MIDSVKTSHDIKKGKDWIFPILVRILLEYLIWLMQEGTIRFTIYLKAKI